MTPEMFAGAGWTGNFRLFVPAASLQSPALPSPAGRMSHLPGDHQREPDPVPPVQHSAPSQGGFSSLPSLPASAEGLTPATRQSRSPPWELCAGRGQRAERGQDLSHGCLWAVGCHSSSRSRNPIPCGCLLLPQGLRAACLLLLGQG